MFQKYIFGAGRHAVETYHLLQEVKPGIQIQAFVVDSPTEDQTLLGVKVISVNDVIAQFSSTAAKPQVLVAIGSIEINKRLTEICESCGFNFFQAINNSIRLENQISIGKGVIIANGTIITSNVTVGDYSIINIGCNISHDVKIGKFVNISPGCNLTGHVVIEDEVFLGAGVTVIPKIKIGKGSIVAAGACVTKDIPPGVMVAGIPAVVKKTLHTSKIN
jgi:acetyltransferase EpsM